MGRDLTRRASLGLIAAAAAFPAPAATRRRILFIGNSFTTGERVPVLVREIAESLGYRVEIDMITRDGARLADHAEDPATFERIAAFDPTHIVLQDHSVVALTEADRARSAMAMQTFSQAHPARTILFETWPRAVGHPLYSEPGMPRNRRQMIDLVDAHYVRMAAALSADVARVGRAWMLAEGIDLYAPDNYHANLAGGWLSAMVLVQTLGLTSSAPPFVPEGLSVRTAKRLTQIARLVSP